MIQDIFPHVMNNSYNPRRPKEKDRVLIYRDNLVLIHSEEDGTCIPTFGQMMRLWPDVVNNATYLFSIDEEGFFLVDENAADVRLPRDYSLQDVLIFREFNPRYLAFAGITGHQLYKWYQENRFCGRCGRPMEDSSQERARVCPSCQYTCYPNINPAVIVAISDGKRLLMARNRLSSYKPYALIAGFVEFGETFEEAVRREVREEVGIEITNIRYYKSQPWAFSCTEMVGFFADLDGDDTLQVDDKELLDAKWFKWKDIPENKSSISIAQEMIETVRERLRKKAEK